MRPTVRLVALLGIWWTSGGVVAGESVPWYLWSTVYPGVTYFEVNVKTHRVRAFPSQTACLQALDRYAPEVYRAHGTLAILVCSPVSPR